MNISYNWLKEYVSFDLTPGEVAEALTSIGLEVGAVEEVQSIKGGLEGIVIGEVLTCEPHPNSDHMHITTVNLATVNPYRLYVALRTLQPDKKSWWQHWAPSCMMAMNVSQLRNPNFAVWNPLA